MTLVTWLHHVVHLTEQVDEQDRLMVQVFKPVHLLLIEVVHFKRRDDPVIIKIDYFIPVL